MRRNILTLFIFIFMISVTAQAQNRNKQERGTQIKERVDRKNHQKSNQQRNGAKLLKLELTDEQKEKMADLRLQSQKETLSYKNVIREKKAKMRTLSTGENYDVNELNKLVDEISDLEASVKKVMVKNRGEMRALLTEDQKIIFDSMPMQPRKMGKRGGNGARKF